MRRLTHLVLSPTSRLVRLMLGEKRIACDAVAPEDALAHLPVLRELDGTTVTGLWAIIDHLENEHPERPLLPADAGQRAEALRLFDWTMNNFHEETTSASCSRRDRRVRREVSTAGRPTWRRCGSGGRR